jgi:hypothetical protein
VIVNLSPATRVIAPGLGVCGKPGQNRPTTLQKYDDYVIERGTVIEHWHPVIKQNGTVIEHALPSNNKFGVIARVCIPQPEVSDE